MPDPMSALATAAASVHELFLAYMKAGFTQPQALYILGVMLAELMAKNAE